MELMEKFIWRDYMYKYVIKTRILHTDKRIVLLFVFILTGIFFYIMNIKTPMFGDDYTYSYSFYSKKRISDLKDIPRSMQTHYYSSNGRVVVHIFAQLFLLIGKKWFNIIHTFSFLLLGVLIFYHAIGLRLRDHISFLIFIYCSLFLFTPAFGQSFLWLTGSSNYMYGILLILLYLIPFSDLVRKQGGGRK